MARQSAEPGGTRPAGRLTPRVAQIAMVVLAAVLTVGTAVFYVPHQLSSYAFAGAPTCTASTHGDCVTRTPVTVSLRGSTGNGAKAVEWVDVQGIGTGATQVNVRAADAAWSRLQPAETGTALIWRGDVVELEFGSAALQTPDWPDYRTLMVYWRFFPALSLFLAAVLLWVVPRRLRHRGLLDLAANCIVLAGAVNALIAIALGRPVLVLYPPVLAAVLVLFLAGRQISRLLWMRKVRRQTEALIVR